jgi:hypothetical protein
MTPEEIKKALERHGKWLRGESGGAQANLAEANLTRANLTRANLARAILTDANLTWANLMEANLTWANLTWVNLMEANLTRANLTRANLTRANLARAILTDANLTDANLTDADLTRANLTRAKTDDGEYAGHAACYFDGHGQCGRQLLAVQFGKVITLYCGCFKGTPAELKAFIAGGPAEYRKSRTLALTFVLAALKLSKRQPKKTTKKASKK